MKKVFVITAALILGACSSEEEKSEKDEAPKLSVCDCKEMSAEISRLANEGLNFKEIEEKIGKEKTSVCGKMFKEDDFMEKAKDCE